MMREVLEFSWYVHEAGYCWIEVPHLPGQEHTNAPQPVLTTGRPHTQENFAVKHYRPLQEHSGLFRTFAETEPAPDAIQEFANQFGLLGGDITLQLEEKKERKDDVTPIFLVEPIMAWKCEILWMRHALELWDSAQQRNTDALRNFIRWTSPEVAEYSADLSSELGETDKGRVLFRNGMFVVSRDGRWPELSRGFIHDELIRPALYFLQGLVNDHMQTRVSPSLLWNPTFSRLNLHLVPNSLIGALWLQMALAIDGSQDYRRCRECRRWFEVSPKFGRKNKQYCSNACRSKAYRKRQMEAQRLIEEGLSVNEIALRIGSDEQTVKAWIQRDG